MADNPNITYANKRHEDFNKRLEQKLAPSPMDVNGLWLSNEIINDLPRVRRDFEQTRDPANQTGQRNVGAETPDETRRGSTMVKQHKPHPAPHPSGPEAQAVDRQVFKERWLAEQRDAVLSQAAERQRTPEPAHEMARVSQEPSR